MRIIKLTERQLREAQNDTPFQYLSDNTTPQYSGNRNIEVANKVNANEFGNPGQNTTDDIADTKANVGYSRYSSSFGYCGGRIHEAEGQDGQENYPDQDVDDDGITNFYENFANNTLDDENPQNNTTVVPNTILQKVDILLNAIKQAELNPRQQAMIASKIMDQLDLEDLSMGSLKNLSLHLKSRTEKK